MLFEPIPYDFYKYGTTYFWVHFGLVIVGFVLAIITFLSQRLHPAPYGKHDSPDAKWGPLVPQRLAHVMSDAVPGVLWFVLIFFLYSKEHSDKEVINYIFFGLFLVHTVHRGIIHPLLMRYKSSKVAIGICLGALIPNFLYHFLNANHISVARYHDNYYYDPRFILGVLLYVIGFVINRWADWKLRSLRNTKGETSCVGYYIPYGGLYELVSCPNYFGETIQWIGWTLATWSLSGLVWTCFSAATFFARAYHNHMWYKENFENYPPNRRAIVPFIY
ncbi:3-oxo-5-alpha-steroid 4-dehydrogenase [Plakobranchus ocellatus]|uniref:3-oxo-5-alpha-steroid 4-dehydrogenase n=1 Tax=Plakobranchus ocellatus TaxID=259542 RepID=A0AAV4CZF9_9GAST|nr:3-oxo-5-alpha-steroid 4-dehydrogenase [Plakobranchus ocellatus]